VYIRFVHGDLLSIQFKIPAISYDGGYTDYVIAPTEAVASILDEQSATEAAPMTRSNTNIRCEEFSVLYANIRFGSNLNAKC